MSDTKIKKPLAAAIGAAVVGSLAASGTIAADNPFGLKELNNGYMQTAMEGKCGEGKCGEGKCGNMQEAEKTVEGKCGEGKCGGMQEAAKTVEGKCGGMQDAAKTVEGKCGEGKCGSAK